MDKSTASATTADDREEATAAFEDPQIGLAQRLVDTLPTFTVTGTGKQRYVTSTVHHECDDIGVFAQTRADQLAQLIDLADNCESQFKPLLRAVTYDMAREVAGLVHALTRNETTAKVSVAAQVIFDVCSTHGDTRAQLERLRYAAAVIQNLADDALKQFENEPAIANSCNKGAQNG